MLPFEDPELIPEVPDETLDSVTPTNQSVGSGAQLEQQSAKPRSEKQQTARQIKAARRAERRMVREQRKFEAQISKLQSPRPEKSRKR